MVRKATRFARSPFSGYIVPVAVLERKGNYKRVQSAAGVWWSAAQHVSVQPENVRV